jgi:hypothetical protein
MCATPERVNCESATFVAKSENLHRQQRPQVSFILPYIVSRETVVWTLGRPLNTGFYTRQPDAQTKGNDSTYSDQRIFSLFAARS